MRELDVGRSPRPALCDGDFDGRQDLVSVEGRRHHALKEVVRGDGSLALRADDDEAGVRAPTSTVGRSDAGSACATLPPIVPQLRTCGIADVRRRLRASIGHVAVSIGRRGELRVRRERADADGAAADDVMPFSSGMRPMSIERGRQRRAGASAAGSGCGRRPGTSRPDAAAAAAAPRRATPAR